MAEIRGGQGVVCIHDAEIPIDLAQNVGAYQPTPGNQQAHNQLAPSRPDISERPPNPHSDFLLIMVTAAPISVKRSTSAPSPAPPRREISGMCSRVFIKKRGRGAMGG